MGEKSKAFLAITIARLSHVLTTTLTTLGGMPGITLATLGNMQGSEMERRW